MQVSEWSLQARDEPAGFGTNVYNGYMTTFILIAGNGMKGLGWYLLLGFGFMDNFC